jgi:hypothetical protein
MSDLEIRMRRLEKRSRLYALLFWIPTVLLLMGQMPQPAAPQVLTVRGLRVVDDQGRDRINLAVEGQEASVKVRANAGGVGKMAVCDRQGAVQAHIQCNSDCSLEKGSW